MFTWKRRFDVPIAAKFFDAEFVQLMAKDALSI